MAVSPLLFEKRRIDHSFVKELKIWVRWLYIISANVELKYFDAQNFEPFGKIKWIR